MPLFLQTPPPSPNPGDPYDADREGAHIRASDDSQSIIEAIYNYLDKYPPTLLTDTSTGLQYNVLAQPAGSTTVTIPGTGALQPGSDVSTNSAAMYTIVAGIFGPNTGGSNVPTIGGVALVATTAENIITFGPSDTALYIQCDFTYSAGIISIVDCEIESTAGSIPSSTISSSGGGSGSGTLYWQLWMVAITAPVGDGPYLIFATATVGGSQNFGICVDPTGGMNDTISGPWGV